MARAEADVGFFSDEPSMQRMSLLCTQLAAFTKAGVPPLRAFRSLARETRAEGARRRYAHLAGRIEEGMTLSEALRDRAGWWPRLFIGMVRVGEHTGRLAEAFAHMAEVFDAWDRLRRRAIQAVAYPALLVFFILFIYPMLVAILRAVAGQGGPAMVRTVLLAVAVGLLQLALAALALAVLWRLGPLRWAWWHASPWLPYVGKVMRDVAAARFCYALALLFDTPMPPHHAIRAAADACGNPVLARDYARAAPPVEAGEPLAAGLLRVRMMPAGVRMQLEVAAQVAEEPRMALRLAREAEDAARHHVDVVVRVCGTVLVLLIGLWVVSGALGVGGAVFRGFG